MAMKLLLLANAALSMPSAALVTEVVKPGKKRQAYVNAENVAPASPGHAVASLQRVAGNGSSIRSGGSAFAPAIACGMTTPIRGGSSGSYTTLLTTKSLQECLDACVDAASCLGVVSHDAGDCYLLDRTYDGLYSSATGAYVANKLADANCYTSYDYLFDGCPRGHNGDGAQRSTSMKIWECQAECDKYSDCMTFETNGCLNNPNCGGRCWTFHGNNNPADIYNGNCDTSGAQKSYLKVTLATRSPTVAPTTAAPTVSPTSSPTTASPTASPTSSPTYAAAGLIGDPHVTNLLGERFDLRYVGDLMLLQVPRGAEENATLLRLDGRTKRVGGLCAKELYLDQVHFTGKWVLARNGAAMTVVARRNRADPKNSRHKQRFRIGGVYIALSHAQTDTGVTYMNLHVTKLSQVGMPIGGLLGDEDFTWAYATPAACQAEEASRYSGSGGSLLVASTL